VSLPKINYGFEKSFDSAGAYSYDTKVYTPPRSSMGARALPIFPINILVSF